MQKKPSDTPGKQNEPQEPKGQQYQQRYPGDPEDEETLIPPDTSDESSPNPAVSGASRNPRAKVPPPEEEDATPEIQPGTEADVTDEDKELLGPKDRDMDMGEDEEIERNR